MNFSGYVGHATNVYYCVLFSCRVRVRIRVRIRFSVCMVGKLLCVAICATLGCHYHTAGRDVRLIY